MPDFSIEDRYPGLTVCGIDEAGRGPWAGPVCAAAAVLDRARLSPALAKGLDDSKKLSPEKRERLFALLQESGAAIGIGWAEVAEIDSLNILKATFLAMSRAFSRLPFVPGIALVDGNRAPPLPCPAVPVIKGDGLSLSIAAASIVAKVSRDRKMRELARDFPEYGWERNAGYGTRDHIRALEQKGITEHHRKSYAPIARLIEKIQY